MPPPHSHPHPLGEHPAAMQRGGKLMLNHPAFVLFLTLIPLLLDSWMSRR